VVRMVKFNSDNANLAASLTKEPSDSSASATRYGPAQGVHCLPKHFSPTTIVGQLGVVDTQSNKLLVVVLPWVATAMLVILKSC